MKNQISQQAQNIRKKIGSSNRANYIGEYVLCDRRICLCLLYYLFTLKHSEWKKRAIKNNERVKQQTKIIQQCKWYNDTGSLVWPRQKKYIECVSQNASATKLHSYNNYNLYTNQHQQYNNMFEAIGQRYKHLSHFID